MRIRLISVILGLLLIAVVLVSLLIFGHGQEVSAAPAIFASPIHAGCYIAGPNDCRIHAEPFTINIAAASKLVQFQLVTISGTNVQRVIYDWRPDASNPAPATGTTYTPSLVAQDFAATCGTAYQVSLQGKDTSNPSAFNLGLTTQFTCPVTAP
jgi:hypothetical protein